VSGVLPPSRKPLRVIAFFAHSVHVAHPHADGSVGCCALWDVQGDGLVTVECDKDSCEWYGDPLAVAADLGISPYDVHPIDHAISAHYRESTPPASRHPKAKRGRTEAPR
jgi:hypothetical protein